MTIAQLELFYCIRSTSTDLTNYRVKLADAFAATLSTEPLDTIKAYQDHIKVLEGMLTRLQTQVEV